MSTLERIDMGETMKSSEELDSWMEEQIVSGKFAAKKYELLHNNCITFANELCLFLTGKEIEKKYFENQERVKQFMPKDLHYGKDPNSDDKITKFYFDRK